VAASGHLHAVQQPRGRPPAVATEHIPGLDGDLTTRGRGPNRDAVGQLLEADHTGVERHPHVRHPPQRAGQGALQVELGERVLERVSQPERFRTAGVEQFPSVAAVVAGAGARHHHRQDPLDDSGLLESAQRLVVDADRLRLVTRRRVLLEHRDRDAAGGQQGGGSQADRTCTADHHVEGDLQRHGFLPVFRIAVVIEPDVSLDT
jgi:hypothetical protein